MSTGKVKWFNPQKGFGFIEPEDKSTDVFVHITAVQNSGMDGLAEDQMVSYELETGQNGKTSAVNLKAFRAVNHGHTGPQFCALYAHFPF